MLIIESATNMTTSVMKYSWHGNFQTLEIKFFKIFSINIHFKFKLLVYVCFVLKERLASNFQFSCLILLSARITDVCHHSWHIKTIF